MHKFLALGAPTYLLEREQFFQRPVEDIFPFFEDPRNLARITPPWLDFQLIGMSTPNIQRGTEIDYTIRWMGVRIRWRTLIDAWDNGRSFSDHQLRGPYILWQHKHTFESRDGGTLMHDVVHYRLPFGPVGMLTHALTVRRQLNVIFDFRRDKAAEIFGSP